MYIAKNMPRLETEINIPVSVWDRNESLVSNTGGQEHPPVLETNLKIGLQLRPVTGLQWRPIRAGLRLRPNVLVSNGDRDSWSQLETADLGLSCRPLSWSQLETGQVWSLLETEMSSLQLRPEDLVSIRDKPVLVSSGDRCAWRRSPILNCYQRFRGRCFSFSIWSLKLFRDRIFSS